MPSWTLFEEQPEDYRRKVLGPGHGQGRHRGGRAARAGTAISVRSCWVTGGAFIGMHSFGASGPYKDVYAKFGITADAAVAAAKKLLK